MNSIISAILKRVKNRNLRQKLQNCPNSVTFGKIDFISGCRYISIGENTGFGNGLFLTAWDCFRGKTFSPQINIGKDCWFGLYNHITSINQIVIGDGCLTGKWVTIADNNHGTTSLCDLKLPPVKRDLCSKGPIIIGKNVWIGDKATILGGVTIGEGAVIAANSVVTRDVPAFCVVGGIPAKILNNK